MPYCRITTSPTIGCRSGDGATVHGNNPAAKLAKVRLREETVKKVAHQTQGEYFYAGTAENLKAVYEKLGSRLTVEKKETELSALLALAAAVLSLLAGGLSLLWFKRVL